MVKNDVKTSNITLFIEGEPFDRYRKTTRTWYIFGIKIYQKTYTGKGKYETENKKPAGFKKQ